MGIKFVGENFSINGVSSCLPNFPQPARFQETYYFWIVSVAGLALVEYYFGGFRRKCFVIVLDGYDLEYIKRKCFVMKNGRKAACSYKNLKLLST